MSAAPADRLAYQTCTSCGAAQTLPRFACARCGSERLESRQATGRGVVYATTVVSRAPTDSFRALAPYTLVLVTLAEGPRVMGHGEPGLAIGDAVSAHGLDHEGRTLLLFRRAAPSPDS